MQLLRPLAVVAALGAGLSTLQAAPPFPRLVHENAAMVLTIHDLHGLTEAAKNTPLWRMAQDPSVLRFFAPTIEDIKWDDLMAEFQANTGFTLAELYGLTKGEAMIYLSDFEFAFNPETRNQPPFVVAIDFGDNGEKIAGLMSKSVDVDKSKGKVREETDTYAGETLHSLFFTSQAGADEAEEEPGDDSTPEGQGKKKNSGPMHWVVSDGVFALTTSKPALIALVDAIKKNGIDEPLERAPRFVKLRERAGDHHLSFLLHFPTIIPAIQRGIEESSKSGGGNPLGIDPATVVNVLGFDAWQDVYLTAQVGEAATVNHYGLTVTERRGLIKLFEAGDGPFPRPSWIPEKWNTVMTTRFSLKAFYSGLEEMLRAISPPLEGMAQGSIQQFGKKAGIDIKRDVFGSFGDEFVQAQIHTANGGGQPTSMPMHQFYAFSLEDAGTLKRAIEALKGALGPGVEKAMEPREYLGHTIYSSPAPGGQGETGFAYAITDRYLMLGLGSAAPVENALQAIAGQGESYWNKPEVREALARVPENATTFQRQDLGPLIVTVFDMLATMPAPPPQADEDGDENGKKSTPLRVDPDAKPSPEEITRYWGENLTYSFRADDGIHAVSRLAHPQP